ncbi:DUF4260 family protein [Amycolatopsis alkalitolerans]|uniref:DUF4260 family protein n=1 Tax=Amycolatopsis alkalitolerans TaxID=2547244 RepID=A0A5C4LXQ1_9PSEU|nr:DUF4260 family protein [Amycolatopsis alkalitolerans]TNC24382.1 DUF4260 family protein [Amycolatopsis alkalitolerans]
MRAATRTANGILGLFLLAFAIFEAVKHGGWAVPMLLAGLIGPDLTFLIGIGAQAGHGVLPRRVVPFYNVAHLWPLPVLALVFFTLLVGSVPGFTLGLAWLAHICLDRALGYGLRARDGTQRAARRARGA